MKLKAFSLCSKKRIYLVGFRTVKYTDLSVVEGMHKQPWHSQSSAGALGIPAGKQQLLGSSAGDSRHLLGINNKSAGSSQDRPQAGKCCCSQGGKSWIREGAALPRPCAPAKRGTPRVFRESRRRSFAQGRFPRFRPLCSSPFQRSASLFQPGCSPLSRW